MRNINHWSLSAVALAAGLPITTTTEPPGGAAYESTTFVVPFEVTLPDWIPADATPATERPNFITWESADGSRAIRILAPESVVPPGSSTRADVPDDYVAHLLSFGDRGVTFSDVVESTVDGQPASIFTATSPEHQEGALGCESAGESTFGECWGLIPDAVLHLAVIDTGERTLLVWERDAADAGEVDYASFDDMLASLHFRTDAAVTTEPAAVASSIDGTWTTTVTVDELASSPLLYDAGELNDENWGQLTFSFDSGRFVETQHNSEAVWAETGTYSVDSDVLTIRRDNGEEFVMRFQIDGDTLTLERDDALGVAPTPWVINPWTRLS